MDIKFCEVFIFLQIWYLSLVFPHAAYWKSVFKADQLLSRFLKLQVLSIPAALLMA